MSVILKDISVESSTAAGVLYKKLFNEKRAILKISLVDGTRVSQLSTEKQLQHCGLNTRGSRLFSGLQVIQI